MRKRVILEECARGDFTQAVAFTDLKGPERDLGYLPLALSVSFIVSYESREGSWADRKREGDYLPHWARTEASLGAFKVVSGVRRTKGTSAHAQSCCWVTREPCHGVAGEPAGLCFVASKNRSVEMGACVCRWRLITKLDAFLRTQNSSLIIYNSQNCQ